MKRRLFGGGIEYEPQVVGVELYVPKAHWEVFEHVFLHEEDLCEMLKDIRKIKQGYLDKQ